MRTSWKERVETLSSWSVGRQSQPNVARAVSRSPACSSTEPTRRRLRRASQDSDAQANRSRVRVLPMSSLLDSRLGRLAQIIAWSWRRTCQIGCHTAGEGCHMTRLAIFERRPAFAHTPTGGCERRPRAIMGLSKLGGSLRRGSVLPVPITTPILGTSTSKVG